jgi:hypothetical protein
MQLNIKNGEVYTFKFNSGEEMVAKIERNDGDWIFVSNPVSIAPGPQGIGLVPSMFTADPRQEIRINIHSIALCGLTDDSVKAKYTEATTGIKVPDKKIILG